MIKNVLKGGTYMIIRKSQIRVDESNLKNGRGVVKREFIVEIIMVIIMGIALKKMRMMKMLV